MVSDITSHHDDTINLLARYGDLLTQYGPDSHMAVAFLKDHPGHKPLEDLYAAATRLKKSAQAKDEEARAQANYLTSQIRYKRLFAAVLLLSLIVVGGLVYIFFDHKARAEKELQERNERFKEMAEFANSAIGPFAHSSVSMYENTNGRVNVYRAVDTLSEQWPPELHERDWERNLLYVWARAAMTEWQRQPSEPNFGELKRRIDRLRTRSPNWGEVDGLLAQIEIARADALGKPTAGSDGAGRSQARRRMYQKAIEFSDAALKSLEGDGEMKQNPVDWAELMSVTRLNRAWAYFSLADSQLRTDQDEAIANLERARTDAEAVVREAPPRFLRGRTPVFETYLDTLGDIYQALLKEYNSGRNPVASKQRDLIPKALAIYTNIAWNNKNARFDRSEAGIREFYLDYARKNAQRLDDLQKHAKDLGVELDVKSIDTE